jgi:molecular chaperone DnaK
MAAYNKKLGTFELTGIAPAPRGVPQIEVTFDIDANGIVHVSAKDLGTGKEQKITITASSGLSDKDIERMVKEAETNRSDDQERRRQVEARNRLDGLIYNTEKLYNEHKEKLGPDEKGQLEQAISQARTALESEDASQMEQAAERLNQASHKLAEAMYSQGGAGAPGGAGAAGGPGAGAGARGGASDEVIDAEYVDVDEKR